MIDSRLRQRQEAYRNRRLLDLCHAAPCFLRFEGCRSGHQDWPSVPCHSDMLRHGRGVGKKSHSIFAVPGCPPCHAAFTRVNLGREGYENAWTNAHEGWMQYLVDNRLIDVV